MAWDFDQIIAFGQQFSGPAGTELAFVLSEWAPEDGLTLTNDYPAVRADVAPTEDAPANQADRVWVKLNSGAWQQVSSVASVTNIGIGSVGVLQSGVASSMIIKGWNAKQIAAGYIIAPGVTLDQINLDRTSGLALIRTYVNADEGEAQPLDPSEPFTQAQVNFLSVWLGEQNITNAEFATLFGVTALELADWLKTHPRKQFAQVVNDRFA